MLPSFVTQTDRSLALNVGKPSLTDMHMCIHQATRNLNLSVAQTLPSHCKGTAPIFRIIFVGCKKSLKSATISKSLSGSSFMGVPFMKIKIWFEPTEAKMWSETTVPNYTIWTHRDKIWSEPMGQQQQVWNSSRKDTLEGWTEWPECASDSPSLSHWPLEVTTHYSIASPHYPPQARLCQLPSNWCRCPVALSLETLIFICRPDHTGLQGPIHGHGLTHHSRGPVQKWALLV